MTETLSPLSPALLAKLRRFVEDVGLNEAARQIGGTAPTITRAMAGLRVNAGTRALIEAWAEGG